MIDRIILAKALWKLDCTEAERMDRREKRKSPERWADPWDASGCGRHQQDMYLRKADFILAELPRIAPPIDNAFVAEGCEQFDLPK